MVVVVVVVILFTTCRPSTVGLRLFVILRLSTCGVDWAAVVRISAFGTLGRDGNGGDEAAYLRLGWNTSLTLDATGDVSVCSGGDEVAEAWR